MPCMAFFGPSLGSYRVSLLPNSLGHCSPKGPFKFKNILYTSWEWQYPRRTCGMESIVAIFGKYNLHSDLNGSHSSHMENAPIAPPTSTKNLVLLQHVETQVPNLFGQIYLVLKSPQTYPLISRSEKREATMGYLIDTILKRGWWFEGNPVFIIIYNWTSGKCVRLATG